MAFFYVKSGGTATGDGGRYTTAKTGSWASAFSATSEYYGSINGAFAATTLPANGDAVFVSDAHAFVSSGVSITYLNYSLGGGDTVEPLAIVVVSDSDVEAYAPATTVLEQVTGSNADINITGGSADVSRLAVWGLSLESGDNIGSSEAADDVFLWMFDCTYRVSGTNDIAWIGENSRHTRCTFKADGSASSRWLANVRDQVFKSCVFTTDQLTKSIPIAEDLNAQFGGVVFEDCDFSLSKATHLVDSANAGDPISATFINCQLPPEMTAFLSGTQSIGGGEGLLVVGCASTSAAAEYQYYYLHNNNYVEDDTAIYRDGSTAFAESSQKVSYKCVTRTGNTRYQPFTFDLPSRFVELSSASEDVLRVFLLSSDAALTDADVRIEAIYPDGTSKHVRNVAENAALDPLRTGTALTTNTEAWAGRTTETRYQIDIDASGDAGADGVPTIRVYVSKPSTTIYFCSTLGLS